MIRTTKITPSCIADFKILLIEQEKSKATVEKYTKALERLAEYLKEEEITKIRLLEYRDHLLLSRKAQTVNGDLSAINAFLKFVDIPYCRLRLLKVQRKAFLDEEHELSQAEYKRLVNTAAQSGKNRLYLIMLTLCGTGIRIGELQYITVGSVMKGKAEIRLKGKNRVVILPKELCRRLKDYIKVKGIKQGSVFQTKSGKPVDRSNVFHDMKKLCKRANVDPAKVFPHNLRHLFARSYYAVEKNLAHLADILGHSRIETTRLYVAVSVRSHERTLRKMGLGF